MKIRLIIAMALFCSALSFGADKTADKPRSRPTNPWDKKIADTLVSYPFEQWYKDMDSGYFSRDEFKRMATSTLGIIFAGRANRQRYFDALSFEDQMLMVYFIRYCIPLRRVYNLFFWMHHISETHTDEEVLRQLRRDLGMDLLRRLVVDKDPRVSAYFTALAFIAMSPFPVLTDAEVKFIIDYFPKIESLLLRNSICLTLHTDGKLPPYKDMPPDFQMALSQEMYAEFCVKYGTAPRLNEVKKK
jgi:hypothetical protein